MPLLFEKVGKNFWGSVDEDARAQEWRVWMV